jgi:hypothetical protein
MARRPDRSERSRGIAVILPPEHELFAVSVACGLSYRKSARLAGYHEDNGFRLMQVEAIRDRVEELLGRPTERILAGINAEFLMMRYATNGRLDAEALAQLRLRLKLLMAHARFSIGSKRQGAGGAVSAEDDHARVLQRLEELDPGRIERDRQSRRGTI